MIFISGKKYQELKDRAEAAEEFGRRITNEYVHMQLLRDIDKECIRALLDVIQVELGPFEKSLVDQTLNQ